MTSLTASDTLKDYPYPARIEIDRNDDVADAILVDYWTCPSLAACGKGEAPAEDLLVVLFAVDGPRAQKGAIFFHIHMFAETERDKIMLANFVTTFCPDGGDLDSLGLRGRRTRVKLGWFNKSKCQSRIVGFLRPGETTLPRM